MTATINVFVPTNWDKPIATQPPADPDVVIRLFAEMTAPKGTTR